MLTQFVRIASRNILFFPRKSLMAILAVAACFFSLNTFQGYIAGTEVIFQDSYAQRMMLGDIVIRKSGIRHILSSEENDLLDENQQAKIASIFQKVGGIDVFVRFLRVSGILSNGSIQLPFTGSGFDAEQGHTMREPTWAWDAVAGRPLEGDGQILLGQILGRLLHCIPATQEAFIAGHGGYAAKERPMNCPSKKLQLQTATVHGQANAVEVEVHGIVNAMFSDIDQRFVYIPLQVAQRLLDTKRISFYSLRLKPGISVENFLDRFTREAKAENLPILARSWKADEVGDFYHRTMDFFHIFRNFMVIVILAVALLSIFNTFYRSVQERTREIGVLRTLGFQLYQVRILFLLETLFLALVGIGIGGGFTLFIQWLFNHISILYKVGLLTQPIPLLISVSPFAFFWTMFVVLGVAIIAAFIPLVIMGRKKITEALTHA